MPSPITSAEPPGEPFPAPGEPLPARGEPLPATGEPLCAPGPARLPELEFVPVPAGWPPYDCEVHGAGCPSALDGAVWARRLAVSEEAGWAAGPGWDGGPRQDGGHGQDGDPRPGGGPRQDSGRRLDGGGRLDVGGRLDGGGPLGAGTGVSPTVAGETTAWPRQFGQVIIEVLAGRRASRQLTAWTTDNARAQVETLVRDLASLYPPQIQRIIASRPAARVVEMTMVVRFGPRSRALALRFEQAPGRKAAPGLPARQARWLCTDIETG